MGKSPCCEKVGLKKGLWTPEEDQKLLAYIQQHGHGSWRSLPAKAGLQRCGKSCRLRWINYLSPDIKRGPFSLEEERTIIRLHSLLGNRWSVIANQLSKRTDNEIKNYWNTHLKKRLIKIGIDPMTHKPKKSDSLDLTQLKRDANLNHMAQWEIARLNAEARLVRESKLHVSNSFQTHPDITGIMRPAQSFCLDVLTPWQQAWLDTPKDDIISGGIFATTTTAATTHHNLESCTSAVNFPENHFSDLMKGHMDILLENIHDNGNYDMNIVGGSSCNGFEEQENCWNNILNLANYSQFDLPLF